VQAHDLVGDRAQLLARAGVGDGQADDHAGRVLQTHRPDGGDHRLADRRALVDEDDGAPGELGRRAIAAVVAVHAREDAALLGVNGLDPVGGDVQCLHDALDQDARAAGRDRPERVVLVARQAQLAHDEDVERRVELARHLRGDGPAAAREAEDDDAVAARIVVQALRQPAAGVGAVTEALGIGRHRPAGRPLAGRVARRLRQSIRPWRIASATAAARSATFHFA